MKPGLIVLLVLLPPFNNAELSNEPDQFDTVSESFGNVQNKEVGIGFPSQNLTCSWFTCDNGKCVLPTVVCNGFDDCGDGSDEKRDELGNCPECPPTYWQCSNGRCIHEVYLCDGMKHCDDLSDEQNSGCPPCPDYKFQCDNHLCVYWAKVCDGSDDCEDMSDETESACPCSDDEIRCPTPPEGGPPGKCIPPQFVCDDAGIWDCPDGTKIFGLMRPTAMDCDCDLVGRNRNPTPH